MPGRTDNVTDPVLAEALLLVRRGQAFWARKLNELRDDEFDAPSLVPGWSRRHVIAHVGFNARAVARLVEWARTGIESPMYESAEQRATEIDLGATLPIEALRNLAAHAAVHLNVEWRDLPADAWSHEVRTAQGRAIPASETVWLRTREVWIHAIDLDNGARFDDLPDALLDALLRDLTTVWDRRREPGDGAVLLRPTDRPGDRAVDQRPADALVVTGTTADLVAWGTGRAPHGGTVGTADGTPAPPAPPWL